MTDLPVDDAITVQISLDGADDYRAEARRMEDLGADVVIAHLGFDERAEASQRSVFDFLPDVIAGTSLPVQAVGGIRLSDLSRLPGLGAPLVVVGAPLVISQEAFSPAVDLHTLGEMLAELVQSLS
jgi:3-hexulose-6-phosphate synthase